ncbi:MAG: helix-turn-helix domain-containing protein [Betaproteobacteria bacterium]|nr:helix-turn-helix domain-containing protein [Betaproteobacteria bacterium]
MRKDYHYTECGLQNVWLVNGYSARKTKYGEGISVHDVDGLHRAIAQALTDKPAPLTGAEVRFLRKEMNLSQRGLGELLGVTDQAVALWERKSRLPRTAERLLRLLYVEHDKGNVPIVGFIKRLNELDQRNHERIVAEEDNGGWKTRHAA